jgi:hypothetical protein
MGTMLLSYYENKEGPSWCVTCYINAMMSPQYNIKIRKGLQFGQFALTPACATCDADPRTAITNPPPMIAPNIAKYFLAILFSCFL